MSFPSEIWLQVADHLPAHLVGDLYTVNRQWFDIAMNARYRQISFAFLNRAMLRDLTRLRSVIPHSFKILLTFPAEILPWRDASAHSMSTLIL
jgi:hypothetical protein